MVVKHSIYVRKYYLHAKFHVQETVRIGTAPRAVVFTRNNAITSEGKTDGAKWTPFIRDPLAVSVTVTYIFYLGNIIVVYKTRVTHTVPAKLLVFTVQAFTITGRVIGTRFSITATSLTLLRGQLATERLRITYSTALTFTLRTKCFTICALGTRDGPM